ncbi:MAG TPA: roadblock/LC7 domain-containing protein [Verrucomicrobiae bacterium]|jgi:predicted regulator of Ras-like GTPase activity (Roadblock/LC7/MglB family)
MHTLPQLLEEDMTVLDGALGELLSKSDAATAIITDKAGFCLVEKGDTATFDVTSVAALASGSFEATQAIARIINENFSCVYQQGEKYSMLVNNIDEQTVLIVIFPNTVSVGLVKFYGAETIRACADQFTKARQRAPGEGIDLAMLNIADTTGVFRKGPNAS